MTIQKQQVAEFKELVAEYNDSFAPATLEERYLVGRLVHADWLSRRCTRLEAAIWEGHMVEEKDPAASRRRAAESLDRLSRALHSVRRNYHSALKRLLAIRAQRDRAAAKQPGRGRTGLFAAQKTS